MICPYCRKPLPNPDEQFCTSCGGDLHAAPPIPDGAGGPVEQRAGGPYGGPSEARSGPAWEQRERLGFATAFIETTKGVLSEPVNFFRNMATSGGIGAPLFYGVLTGYIGLLAASVYQLVIHLIMGSAPMAMGDSPQERVIGMFRGGLTFGGFLLQIVVGPILIAVGLLIAAGIWHLMLMLMSGANKDFEATLRVACYSEATAVFQLVPVCGGLVAGIWYLVNAVLGLSEAHGISRGKAAAAVLVPIVLVCCCCAGVSFFLAGSIASLARR